MGKALAWGFGMVIAAGVLYALWTDPTARVVGLALGMFVLGAVLIGIAILYATKNAARSVAEVVKGPAQDRRSYHAGAPNGRDWVEGEFSASGFGLPPVPPRGLLGAGKDGDEGEDEEFVA